MAAFPTTVPTNSDLYIAINTGVTSLTANINDSTLTIPVTSTTGFPSVGAITIDGEIIHYTSIGPTQFNADARGFDGTVANSHTNGAQVNHYIIAAHHNVLKDEIIAIAQNLADRIGLHASQITLGDNLNANSFKLTNLATGTTAGDSLRYEQVVGVYLPLAGGTLTAPLTISQTGGNKNDVIIHDSTNTQRSYIMRASQATTTQLILSVNRDPVTGTFSQTGQAASGILFDSRNLDGNIQFFTASANNTAPTQTVKIINTGQTQFSDGTVSLPGISFLNDTNTGIYRPNSDEMSIATNGVERVRFKNAALEMRSGVIENTNGTSSLPAYSFANDTDTGFYLQGTNAIGIVTGGTEKWRFSGSNLSAIGATFLEIADGTASAPALTFAADPDTGFYNAGTANTIRATVGGVQKMRIDATGTFIVTQAFASDGSASAPGFSFDLDTNTGFYRNAADNIGVAANGAEILRMNAGSPGGIEMRNGNIIYNTDGSVSNPSFTFANDADTGFYRIGSNQVGMASGGFNSLVFGESGSATGNTFNPFSWVGSRRTDVNIKTTTGVSTTTTDICATTRDGGIFMVYGKQTAGGTAEFCDLVIMVASGTVATIGSATILSPNTRTYSVSGSNLRVAMGANTYTITVNGWSMSG